MNLTAKILVVLILVMTLAFMFVQMSVFAYRENWKRRWDEDTRNLQNIQKVLEQRVATESFQRAAAEADKSVYAAQLQQTQADLDKARSDIQARNDTINGLEDKVRAAEVTIKAKDEQIQALAASLEAVRKRNAELNHIAQVSRGVAFQLNVKLAEIEDDLNAAVSANTEANEQLAKLNAEKSKHEGILGRLRDIAPETYRRVVDEKGGPLLEAVVAAVNKNPQGQQDLVMLTIGSVDGVEPGIEFTIYRGGEYICRVRAERVLNGMLGARVIPESWNTKSLEIRQGDLAANHL
jgi:septal ring factor EnvC (AmiA/AmiB activator)